MQKILSKFNIDSLNKMQESIIAASEIHKDIILLSPTGSGKTLGFLIPMLKHLKPGLNAVQALIIVPSRELGIQIEQVFKQMGTEFKVNCFYGGHSTRTEKLSLTEPPAVLIGTPGRIAMHIQKNNFITRKINMLILDEFDKSLEFGFKEDMSFIISNLENIERRILTSATSMEEIPSFTGVVKPFKINFLHNANPTTAGLNVKYMRAEDADKLRILLALVCMIREGQALIFCNHREAVERIQFHLKLKGIASGIYHGGLEQEARERELIKFRNGSQRLLVTTDLASRGLDIPDVENIIHYQLPPTEEGFTHRNGRTARMNADGTAWLLLAQADYLPAYLTEAPEEVAVQEDLDLPPAPAWQSLYISSGKKDKISKTDILGFLIQKGKLKIEEVGRIDVLDHFAYVAVKAGIAKKILEKLKGERIKNKLVKIEVSR